MLAKFSCLTTCEYLPLAVDDSLITLFGMSRLGTASSGYNTMQTQEQCTVWYRAIVRYCNVMSHHVTRRDPPFEGAQSLWYRRVTLQIQRKARRWTMIVSTAAAVEWLLCHNVTLLAAVRCGRLLQLH